jgi:hypothetical protein
MRCLILGGHTIYRNLWAADAGIFCDIPLWPDAAFCSASPSFPSKRLGNGITGRRWDVDHSD